MCRFPTLALLLLLPALPVTESAMADDSRPGQVVRLPEPRRTGPLSLEETIQNRRSVRDYRDAPLSLAEVSQLLWAAQGITDLQGHRTTPSGGALYPLEVFLVAGKVRDLAPGVYRYVPKNHELHLVTPGDRRKDLCLAALNQEPVHRAPVVFLLAAVYDRITGKYGARGRRYAHIEAGHVGQNVQLQAVSLGLASAVIGAFEEERVRKALTLTGPEQPLYLLPAGRPR